MKRKVLYIATASWEQRFIEGAKRIIEDEECTSALCLWFEDYGKRSATARNEFAELFRHLNPRFENVGVIAHDALGCQGGSAAMVETWRRIFNVMSEELTTVERFVFDITTTPRAPLWSVLDLLTQAKIPGSVVYHRAGSHGPWCGSEPTQPLIVPKLGGLSRFDLPTKLVVLSGFDADRCEHFVSYYEPEETLIILQDGSSEDPTRNREPHLRRFQGRSGIRMESMNSYAADWGLSALERLVREFTGKCNVVLASVGPKTSAVSLYIIHRMMSSSAIVYSPCRDYNVDYSTGIGETLRLQWDAEAVLGLEGYLDSIG